MLLLPAHTDLHRFHPFFLGGVNVATGKRPVQRKGYALSTSLNSLTVSYPSDTMRNREQTTLHRTC